MPVSLLVNAGWTFRHQEAAAIGKIVSLQREAYDETQ
jgi:hypothetical protein